MSLNPHIDPGIPRDDELTLRFTKFVPHQFHRVPTYHFLLVHAVTGEEMGQINLRAETNETIERYAGHIGYSVHEAFRGHRNAARSTLLLLPLARQLGIDPLWIT